jgi:fibronectin-binding autotransporter adhesin
MKIPRTPVFFRLAPAFSAAALAVVPCMHAADGNWNIDAGGNWSLNTNWSSNPTVPGGAGSIVGLTANITGVRTVTIDGTSGTTQTVGILNIGDSNGTSSYGLAASAGNGLVFDNSGNGAQLNQVSTSFGDTLSTPITLNDNLTISNASSSSLLTLSGAINGAKTITNAGSGGGVTLISGNIGSLVTGVIQDSATSQLTLGGTNTFTAGVTIKKGTVLANSSTALGTVAGTTLLGDTSGTANATLLVNNVTLANNITVQAGSSGNTLTIASNGAVAARMTGNIVLNNNLTLTVDRGGDSGRGTGVYLGHSTGTITGAGNLNLNVTGSISTSNATNNPTMDSLSLAAVASTGSINNIGTGTGQAAITGNITGSGASVNQNSATSMLTLSGTNTYTGATNVNAGVLRVTSTGGLSSASAVTVASGATLLLQNVNNVNAASLTISGNGSSSGAGALAALNGVSYLGTVNLAADATISSDLYGSNTTLTLSNANAVTGTNKTLTVAGVDHTNITGIIATGSGGLTKLGTGTLTLGGANTFTGLTQVNRGTLSLNSASALGGGGNITFGGGALQYTNNNNVDYGSRIINSTGPISIDTNGQSRSLSAISASNTGGLTKLGSSTLTLSGTNAYTGITAINTGTLAVTSTTSLPGSVFIDTNGALNSGGAYANVTAWLGSGKIATGSTGVIALTGNSAENINFSGFGTLGLGASSATTYTGTITPAGTTYRLGGGGQNLTLSGTNALTGANALIVSGPVILTGANNLSGATTVAYNNTGGSNTLTLSGAGRRSRQFCRHGQSRRDPRHRLQHGDGLRYPCLRRHAEPRHAHRGRQCHGRLHRCHYRRPDV